MREEVLPITERMEGLVREVLGPGASKMKVRFSAIATIGQCVMPTFINRLEKLKPNAQKDSWRIEDIEAYAGHVANFSLAGMRAVPRAVEENGAADKSPRKKTGRLRPTTGRRKVAGSPKGEGRFK